MTVIGPLTTTFTAPSSCTTSTPQIYQIWTSEERHYVQGPLFTAGSDCYPSGYDASPSDYYSPAVCPHGYTPACTRFNPVTTASETETETETETAYICCPTALSYTCLQPSSQAAVGCTTSWKSALAVIGATVISDGTLSGYTTASETEGGFAAYSIQVRFKSGELSPLTKGNFILTSSLSTTPSPSPSTIVATITVPTQLAPQTSTSTPSTPSNSNGVSTPAAVGIGVGSAAAGILGAIGLFFFLRRRRKRRRPPPVPPKERHAPPYELSEEFSTPRKGNNNHHSSLRAAFMRGGHGHGHNYTPAPSRPAAELEAHSHSTSSLRDITSSPESGSSAWTTRQQRDGVMPMPWI
ncbi:hypothetical protein QBC46DRAFT_369287 [Diplogelasinospora grovesii]|uniref:Uncharacterized protein n=1 Tax=Diplogelasinospora grovesii TaxID=303347 RepID=A0AAN6SAP6_9PEZI|nr:hypothetical protein QBC46DRAFT_369287 [Diplogelasinospora grovesii]